MSPEFTAAVCPIAAAAPPDLSPLFFLFLARREQQQRHPSPPLRPGRKHAIIAALILGRAREASQAVRPTINPPIMSPRGVQDARAIITYPA